MKVDSDSVAAASDDQSAEMALAEQAHTPAIRDTSRHFLWHASHFQHTHSVLRVIRSGAESAGGGGALQVPAREPVGRRAAVGGAAADLEAPLRAVHPDDRVDKDPRTSNDIMLQLKSLRAAF